MKRKIVAPVLHQPSIPPGAHGRGLSLFGPKWVMVDVDSDMWALVRAGSRIEMDL